MKTSPNTADRDSFPIALPTNGLDAAPCSSEAEVIERATCPRRARDGEFE